MQKGSKEWREAKDKAREALDARVAGVPFGPTDSTVGHYEGPEGTWNTSGVELPLTSRDMIRDIRPETGDPVSLEGLQQEQGVPVRTEEDMPEEDAKAQEEGGRALDERRTRTSSPAKPKGLTASDKDAASKK